MDCSIHPSRSSHHRNEDALPPRPSSVCEPCWIGPFAAHFDLFHDEGHRLPARDGGYSYFTSTVHMEQGAAASCVWCKVLCAMLAAVGLKKIGSIARRPDGRWKITLIGRNVVQHCTPTGTQELTVIINDRHRLFAGYVHTASDDPAAPYIVARNPILDVGSARSLTLARSLINECVFGHDICARISPSEDVRLPTRVLDCTNPSRPRIASTEGKHGKYLALSYVWGEAQPHQTTKANIAAYLGGIDTALLPQTLRDAIHITCALGFQYLWTDSLCIIQDEDEDKLHELGRMHLIYRYAYLTIIAASAEKVSDGFLQRRPATPSDITLPFICPPRRRRERDHKDSIDGQQRVGTLDVSLLLTLAGETDIEQYNHTWEPISARGWCLQEYLMSPRALIFTSETLQLRCQTTTQNVGGAYYNGPFYSGEQRLPSALFQSVAPRAPYGSAEWRALHGVWRTIVEDYTGRIVGESTDKLVACGAIAEAFHRALHSDYLAGLWRATLLHDLLWERDGDVPRPECRRRAATYRAPSWSWASVDGRVKMPDYSGLTGVAEAVKCEVLLRDPQLPFGQVTGGVLVLRAALKWCGLLGSLSTNIDDAADAEIADQASISAWLLPLLLLEGDRRPEVVGLVVALADLAEGSLPQESKSNIYRRMGTFSRMCDWAEWQRDGSIPSVQEVLLV